jgi:hypothetical protein
MIDEGVNPFDGEKIDVVTPQDSADELAGTDLELLEVVDAFESE